MRIVRAEDNKQHNQPTGLLDLLLFPFEIDVISYVVVLLYSLCESIESRQLLRGWNSVLGGGICDIEKHTVLRIVGFIIHAGAIVYGLPLVS